MEKIIYIPNPEIRDSIVNGEITVNVEMKNAYCLNVIGMQKWEYEYFDKTFLVSPEFLPEQTEILIGESCEHEIKHIKCKHTLKEKHLETLANFLWENDYITNLNQIRRGYFGHDLTIKISTGTKTVKIEK